MKRRRKKKIEEEGGKEEGWQIVVVWTHERSWCNGVVVMVFCFAGFEQVGGARCGHLLELGREVMDWWWSTWHKVIKVAQTQGLFDKYYAQEVLKIQNKEKLIYSSSISGNQKLVEVAPFARNVNKNINKMVSNKVFFNFDFVIVNFYKRKGYMQRCVNMKLTKFIMEYM